MTPKIIAINSENLDQYAKGPACFTNPKSDGAQMKFAWLKKRFTEGLKIKVIYSSENEKVLGFIEYCPGEYAWRAVEAPDYLFIHCIWIYGKKNQRQGLGSALVKAVINDSKQQNKLGVAVITSRGSFMADSSLFLKNGFKPEAREDKFELLVKPQREGRRPCFADYKNQLQKYQGLHIIYSHQCPWVSRSIKELKEIAKQEKIQFKVTELQTAGQAQKAPSIYTAFNLVNDGRLIVDHYISSTRFKNILKKELK